MEDQTAEEIVASRAEKRARLVDRIGRLTGERVDKFAVAIVITFSTEDAAAPELTREQTDLRHTIEGRYWEVANLDGTPVYRQEPPYDHQCLDCHELFLWRNDTLPLSLPRCPHRGWYLTRRVGADMFETEDNRVAWGRSRPLEPHTFPLAFHVPYNCPQPERGVEACSYTSLLESSWEQMLTPV